MCQTPIIETNCSVMMMPKIIGTKSPMRLIDGIKSMGKANKIRIIAATLVTEIIFGRVICAIIKCV